MTKSPLINWLLGIVAICFVCNVCGYGGLLLPPFFLMFGWVAYLVRLPEVVTAHAIEIGIALVGLAGLTFAIHAAGRCFRTTPPWTWRHTFGLTGCLGALLVAAVGANDVFFHLWKLTAEPVYAPSGIREAAARTHSINNLKNIAIGVQLHHDSVKHLPVGGTFDTQGRGMHGWQTMLLPHIDQGPLFHKIDLKQPWNAAANGEWMRQEISVYRHPAIDPGVIDGFPASHYAGNVHVLGPMKMTNGDITDGLSNTILTGEVTSNFKPWGSPTNWRDPGLGLHTHADGFGGPSPGVTAIGFADGTVRMVRNDVSPDLLKALSTPRGGEKIDVSDLDR